VTPQTAQTARPTLQTARKTPTEPSQTRTRRWRTSGYAISRIGCVVLASHNGLDTTTRRKNRKRRRYADAVTECPDYIQINRTSWDAKADEYAGYALHQWSGEPAWGIFSVPDAEVGVLPDDLVGKQVLDAGCGTGYVSAWMARRGANPVGVDNSPRQLATAARFQDRYDLQFPLILGIAEELPFRDETFDVVISEYGASLWSDPYRWIPEASRVLRPGGELVILSSTLFVTMFVFDDETIPADRTLKRDYFGAHSQQGRMTPEWSSTSPMETGSRPFTAINSTLPT